MFNDSTKNAEQPNEAFRFVQLSDPHLSSPSYTNPLQISNKRILGYLSWLRNRRHTHKRWVLDLAIKKIQQLQASHCVITGDLTHIGLQNEFEQVAQWLAQVGNASDITVIPGNHDLYVNERWDRSFAKWENYMRGDDHHQLKPIPSNDALQRLEHSFPSIRIRGNVAFISVSSIFAAPWFRATGRIDQKQLNKLQQLLQEPHLKDLCKVLLIHHPVTTQSITMRKCLLNHTQLTEVLYNTPVQLVLHGHGHKTSIEKLPCCKGYEIPVIGAASSSSINQKKARKAEFLLFDITDKDQHWHIQMRNFNLDLKQKEFTQTQASTFTVKSNF